MVTQTRIDSKPMSYHPRYDPLYSESLKSPFLSSNKPTAMRPHIPQAPCTCEASTGSSTPSFFHILQAMEYTILPMSPMKNADHGSHLSQTPVIDTSPEIMPLVRAMTSYLRDYEYVPIIRGFRKAETIPPVDAHIMVFIMILEQLASLENMLWFELALKNNQHTNNINVPKTTNGKEL